jgi:hypothetical protein
MTQMNTYLDEFGMYVARRPVDKLRETLDAGFDVNQKIGGITLLSVASRYGWTDVVEMLLQRGAHVDIEDARRAFFGGTTAFFSACSNGHVDIIKKLFAAGCDVNTRDVHGVTAFWIAVNDGKKELAEMLIDFGIDVELLPLRTLPSVQDDPVKFAADTKHLVAEARPRQAVALLNWLLAMAPLELPIYIYLELADRSVVCPKLKEIEKIKIIQGVMDACRRVKRVRDVARLPKLNEL